MAEIALGSYPAKRCARSTHNRFDPTAPTLGPPDPARQALVDAGIAFEAAVVETLAPTLGDGVVVVDAADWSAAVEQTAAAMDAGVPVIAGARLPNVNGRSGAPDLLIRHGDGYLPVDIKNHKTLDSPTRSTSPRSRASVQVAPLSAPGQIHTVTGLRADSGKRREDAMQLAHYTRMLQDLGRHGGELIGGVIGATDLTAALGTAQGVVWHPLEDTLARYDEEFALRLRVAEAAREGRELVRPVRISECDSCDWFPHCAQVAGPDDASFAVLTGHLSLPEWRHLYDTVGDGARLTVEELAGVDVEAHRESFAALGQRSGLTRLANAVRRAAMTVTGVDVEPNGSGWPDVPTADIEIDFDIEHDMDHIYQWGVRIRDGQDDATARYEPTVSFDPMDDAGEAALADEFADWLEAVLADARRTGRSVTVFHWSPVEIHKSAKFPRVAAALAGHTVDLMAWFKAEFFARTSSSIKAVAPLFGFDWDHEDSGGLTALLRIEQARAGSVEAKDWCLRYNCDDTAAQAAIRDGLRALRPPGPAAARRSDRPPTPHTPSATRS
ncbi:ribonuclease H-like domain-containing protein [Mycolicibacterium brumae]|uniref:Recombinase RecB n=1 Tax=Mycolicibacterium brumae TaxID=85968 RepID=A0A2G5PGW6_9MYCO|nr:ribonuclease H-like domain-containing protein [Mycolicibacterium brumae]MCV7192425.1 ribonuclease H-like domain-containing protein [Mycolicibacterium brumae]PIB77558.1 recombinase RecB [Mycolicibacterium brumae]RWA18583.1 hypothetical protein MBRU_05010 [Mycolicibacterium brumae DSM 44177]UWW10193.1 ribonuclease H-like domain-containing protein [Mycolicibacterium brumae]